MTKQVEAEVVPSSSLVEVEVEVEVGVGVEVEIGVWVSMQFDSAIEIFDDFCGFHQNYRIFKKFSRVEFKS